MLWKIHYEIFLIKLIKKSIVFFTFLDHSRPLKEMLIPKFQIIINRLNFNL